MKKDRIHDRDRHKGRVLERFHTILLFILFAAVVFVLFRFVIGIARISGDSMYPALEDGDLVVYGRIIRTYEPGDIVSVRVPAGKYYVKRVIACGGDTVDIRDGSVFVNGKQIEDDWAFGMTEEETGAVVYPYTVRPGAVFVLGDNREVSMDSRAFGEVGTRQIRGKVIWHEEI